MSQTLSYKNVRDLLTGMSYKRGNTGVASRTYTYDAAGRPITRNTARNGTTVNDSFGYNNRSELTAATVNNGAYSYNYDNIGNRNTAQEITEEITNYTANNLNQYTAIGDFAPTYDAAGNQTLVKTTTGIWTVAYDAENRPVSFTNAETNTVIECSYDHMGRRATKKVTVNGSVTLHHRYLYRGYLQIACCDLTRSNHPALWLITWDPSQPIATRPLAIQKDGTWYTYGWDLTKNICELYGQHGYIRTNYTYTPYGEVTAGGDVTQPIQWSSEFHDDELALVYYNYRHYNPTDGRWLGRDLLSEHYHHNIYTWTSNTTLSKIDYLGLNELIVSGGCNPNQFGMDISTISPQINTILYGWFNVQRHIFEGTGFHDRKWSNFIEAAEHEIKKRKEKLAPGETIEWAVEINTYATRAFNDTLNPYKYINIIRTKASELGVQLRFYNSKESFANIVNTSATTIQKNNLEITLYFERIGNSKISRFIFFGHGVPGQISLSHDFNDLSFEPPVYEITTDDIKNGIFKKSSFVSTAVSVSCACNSSTKPTKGGPSFTEAWEAYFGSIMYGINGQSSYFDPSEIKPSTTPNQYDEKPSWKPGNPNL